MRCEGWTEEEFFREATSIQHHPYDEPEAGDPDVRFAVRRCLERGPGWPEQHLKSTLDSWRVLQRGLLPKEEALHEAMHEGPRRINAGRSHMLLRAPHQAGQP